MANDLPAQAGGQTIESGSILGRVLLDDGSAAPGAVIWLVGTARHTLADSVGGFALTDVPGGVQEIEARSPLGGTARTPVTVRAGREASVTIVLGRIAQQLGGVTVLATSSDALARVPGSIGVVTSAQLEAIQPVSANDALRTIPGVHLQEEEGFGLRANIGIRGLDPDRSRSVLVLEDGVPVSLAPYGEPELYYSPPIDRMSRVEVIKGSGSILFGPQTIGGVVNYVTADLPTRSTSRVLLQGGSSDARMLRLQSGGRLGPVRGTISAFERSVGNLNGLDARVRDVTTKLGWQTSAGDFGIKLSAYNETSNATYIGLTDSMFQVSPQVHPQPGDRLDVRRYAATASHEVSLGTNTVLRTNAYAYQTDRDWNRRDYTYGPTGNTHVFRNTTGSRDRSFAVAGVEPRLRTLWWLGDKSNELDAGVRVHVERTRDQHVNGTVGSDERTIRDDELRVGRAASAFLQNRIALTPALSITPGVRFEHFTFGRDVQRTRVRRQNAAGVVRGIEDVALGGSDNVSEFIPGLGVSYAPSELVSVFAGAHRGFAPPRTKDALIYGDATVPADGQIPELVSLQLQPERSWNVEAGTRLTPRPWLSFETTVFHLDFSNQIIAPSLSAGTPTEAQLANQGATRHLGVEAAGQLDIGRLLQRAWSLTIDGGITQVSATFSRDRFVVAPGGDTVNVRANALPYAPRLRAHAAATLTLPNQLVLRVDALQVGAQFSDNFETVAGSANGRFGRVPAYAIFDASVRYTIPGGGGVGVVGSVKNLTDRTYISSRRPEGIQVGMPRLLTVGLSWDR